MKMKSIAAALVVATWLTGCVTEGGLALEPASAEEQARANLAVGIGYLQEERPDFAIEALQRAIAIDPRMADAHSTIAVAYDQAGEPDLAEEHHRRATQLAPAVPGIQNSFAVYLCRQNRWADAQPYFERAIVNAEDGGMRYMINAATCARAAGQPGTSETFYRSALDINARSVDALRGMIDVSIQQQNLLQGRAFWQRLEQNSPLVAEDLLSCYVIESGLGDATTARDCADRLQREYPGSAALRRLRELERNGG
jgi:type IV pilus assembly protein PilF